MSQFKCAFSGARMASWRQIKDAFEKCGIRVSYVEKRENEANTDFLVTFANENEMRRALELAIKVAGECLQPAPSRYPHLAQRPYAHVKVPDRSTVLPVTWHDGTVQGRISGELRGTLTAFTPLLAGNEQYSLRDAKDASKAPNTSEDENAFQIPWFDKRRVNGNRTVLEPLRDNQGRVLIPGEQIKGMVRQSIGALLGAPMEHVKEQSFSYRPNLMWPRGDLVLEPRPAIVKEVRDFEYAGHCYRLPVKIDMYPMERSQFNHGDKLGHRYRGGMEGWEDTFSPSGPELSSRPLHTSAELKAPKPDMENIEIDDSVHTLWAETYCHLIDEDGGHISPRHPSLSNDQAKRRAVSNLRRAADRGFREGDLIYVEWDTARRRVVSYGHHYYYRWRYLNTVCRRKEADGLWAPRSEVSPCAVELEKDANRRPFKLTGARAFFGYISDNKINAGIGAGDFTQLAGRVSFNVATEQIPTGVQDRQRFLAPNSGFAVSLQELATPKPSAVEFYVDQSRLSERRQCDRGVVITYGDLPDWDPPGDLAGRKFYRHNPRAAEDVGQYTADTDADLLNERAAIARFVSTPRSKFRFKVRFRDLSRAELGVLLIALCPDQFACNLPEEIRAKAGVKIDGSANQPRYATKLGHARPLGWGSVRITVDAAYEFAHDGVYRLDPLDATALGECVNEAADLLNQQALREWFAIHDFRDSCWAPYPRRDGDGEIYGFHAEIRKNHSRGRRQRP